MMPDRTAGEAATLRDWLSNKLRLDPPEKNKYEQDDHNDAKDSGRTISPAAAVAPSRQRSDKQKNKND
jgi:hypothetical protein